MKKLLTTPLYIVALVYLTISTGTPHLTAALDTYPLVRNVKVKYSPIVDSLVSGKPLTIDTALCNSARRYEFDCDLARAMWTIETSNRSHAERYEESTYIKLSKHERYKNLSAEARKTLATSYGPLQVLGVTGKEHCNMTIEDLKHPFKNIECAMSYLNHLYKKTNDITHAVRLYNGQGQSAEHYKTKVFKIVWNLKLRNLTIN